MVKDTICFYRGPGFDFQYLHGSLQPSITPVSRDLMASSGPLGHKAHTWYIGMHAGQNSRIHEIRNGFLFYYIILKTIS